MYNTILENSEICKPAVSFSQMVSITIFSLMFIIGLELIIIYADLKTIDYLIITFFMLALMLLVVYGFVQHKKKSELTGKKLREVSNLGVEYAYETYCKEGLDGLAFMKNFVKMSVDELKEDVSNKLKMLAIVFSVIAAICFDVLSVEAADLSKVLGCFILICLQYIMIFLENYAVVNARLKVFAISADETASRIIFNNKPGFS